MRVVIAEDAALLREGLTRLRDWYRSRGESPEALLRQEVVRNWEPREGGRDAA